MDAAVKELKVIEHGKDAGRKLVPVSGGHRDIIDLAKALVRFLSNLAAKGCWLFENRVFFTMGALGGIFDFSSFEQTPW